MNKAFYDAPSVINNLTFGTPHIKHLEVYLAIQPKRAYIFHGLK